MEGEAWEQMTVYAPTITNRLRYVIGFIGQQLTTQPVTLTDNQEDYISAGGIKINYSNQKFNSEELWIKPVGLLESANIEEQNIICFDFNGEKSFFKTDGDWPFDIFAAIFYLLTRYEEYLPHRKDMYGRYAHENSLAFREGFLNKPLINIWLGHLKTKLGLKPDQAADTHFPFEDFERKRFSFLPTYDIDEAYSFKHKEWIRKTGGAIKDLFSGNMRRYKLRNKVLSGKKTDPFDSYSWMDNLHQKHVLHPHYFFLVAGRLSKYDRNILPSAPALEKLVKEHSKKYSIGIHPSWQSYGKIETLKAEIETLEKLSGQKIISSRQHYIRFELPATYRMLIDCGIIKDFSMGYGSINGFRASIASSFYWYDLEKEEQTNLLVYPFCFMEANSFFEQKQTPEKTLDEMRYYYRAVKDVNGILITIWHNTFLGTDSLFAGWREVYQQFIEEIISA